MSAVYDLYTMTIPVTARLDEAVVEALDQAVDVGLAPNRSVLVARAVAEWLDRHGEEAIVASYRRAYAAPDPEHDALVAAIGEYSLRASLSEESDDAPG